MRSRRVGATGARNCAGQRGWVFSNLCRDADRCSNGARAPERL